MIKENQEGSFRINIVEGTAVSSSVSELMKKNPVVLPSSMALTITEMFFKSFLNSMSGEQRIVILLIVGSNWALGPINGPSPPQRVMYKTKLYGRS